MIKTNHFCLKFKSSTVSLLNLYFIEKKSMGNQQNQDNRVRLYLTTQRPLIYAGQYLQGTAHV